MLKQKVTKPELDYNDVLKQSTEYLEDKVRKDTITLEMRFELLESISSKYVLSRDLHYERMVDDAIKNKRSVGTVNIPYRDQYALDRLAVIALHDDLTWSHPDKMSIIEYPIMSERQEDTRSRRTTLVDDMIFGDRRGRGRGAKAGCGEGSSGGRQPLGGSFDEEIELSGDRLDIERAIVEADLTELQKQAVMLTHVDGYTQTEVATNLGVRPEVISRRIKVALGRMRDAVVVGDDVIG